MAAPAPVDDAATVNALAFVRQQLSFGQATPELKATIHEMLVKAKVYADEPKADAGKADEPKEKKEKKKEKSASKGKSAEYEAECLSCLEERVGQFYKRGFKCNWCAGTENGRTAAPVSSRVPAAGLKSGFVLLDSTNDAAMRLQPPHDISRGMSLRDTMSSADGQLRGADSEAPGIVVGSDSTSLLELDDDIAADNNDDELPLVKHALSVFPYTDGEKPAAGTVQPERVSALRRAYFPTLLYMESMARDDARKELLLVTESVRLLKVRGAVLPHRKFRNFELVMQVSLSALHAMQYLQSSFTTAHGDLRPYNFFIDKHHNVKLRYAPFSCDALLPTPFRAPEDDPDLGDERIAHEKPEKAMYARDMYALGVTLTIIAYGEPVLPAIGDVEAGQESALVRFIEPMLRDNPNERCTVKEALASRFHSTVRFVNGTPLESVFCRIDMDDKRTPKSPMASLAAESPNDSRSSPFAMSSSFKLGSSGSMRVPDKADLTFAAQPSRVGGELAPGQATLAKFFSNCGPMFQVIRTDGHVTIYSVRKDPRRKANVSFLDTATEKSTSPGGSRRGSNAGLVSEFSTPGRQQSDIETVDSATSRTFFSP